MSQQRVQQRVQKLLAEAEVATDGTHPWDIRVHDPHFHARVLAQGSLGMGESYMEGWWDTPSLDDLLFRLLNARLEQRVHSTSELWDALRARVLNLQSRRRSREVGERHYDLGNDLYAAMLGQRLVYSCAYWTQADGSVLDSLDAAQEAKLDLVCRKLRLQPGMRVLDIGCGWGEALKFAAERCGISGVGVTVSKEQADYARDLCAGLPIEIRLQDYRELDQRFDAAFSLGMFEHVGVRNYESYFQTVRGCLPPGGVFLLHSIGTNRSVTHTDPWIGRYIFPNSMLPSAAQITKAMEGQFVLEDWHSFGTDYDLTLQAWRDNIERAWPALPARYDERFRRMWRYYLAASMATFRTRNSQVWQLVLSKGGVPGGYLAPR